MSPPAPADGQGPGTPEETPQAAVRPADPGDVAIVVCFEDRSRRRFLMVRHGDRGWELPGGRVEAGESAAGAAVREFAEETGHRLVDPEAVVTQTRERGTFHVVAGTWGPPVEGEAPGEAPARSGPGGEPVEAVRFVERVTDVRPLAFPDDPYEAMGKALGRSLR